MNSRLRQYWTSLDYRMFKDIQSFLEFVVFYKRFIKEYLKITTLLTLITKKNISFT